MSGEFETELTTRVKAIEYTLYGNGQPGLDEKLRQVQSKQDLSKLQMNEQTQSLKEILGRLDRNEGRDALIRLLTVVTLPALLIGMAWVVVRLASSL